MRKYVYLLAAAVLAAFSVSAHADTISTFDLTNFIFPTGAVNSGSITIDTSTGVATGLNFNYSSSLGEFSVSEILEQGPGGVDGSTYIVIGVGSKDPLDTLYLYFKGSSLADYAGGPACTLTQSCDGPMDTVMVDNNGVELFDDVQSGDITLVSSTTTGVTPEPSTFALFGTGAIGLLGLVRRYRRC
jgi:hypothetical protein